MPVAFGFTGPNTLPGQVFSTTLGTAVAFSAGVAVAYAGLALQCPAIGPNNPAPGKKLIPLRVAIAPTTLGIVNAGNPWGLLKLTVQGTAALGTPSAAPGAIFSPGIAGTSTGIAQVIGTFTVLNGTAAGTGVNTLYWAEILGCLGVGTATSYAPTNPAVDMNGYCQVMPGETIAIGANITFTGLASISWLEVPLSSGA